MVTEREKMRAHKEWELADRLRKKIEKMGFQVEDHTSGPLVFSTE
jgi:cysteinyl-tRNA synthetase